ncbi:outer membrane protein assembly factor BamE [Histophilus somni]|uniref:Outer membrane protein assembly factor BamE n=1 Tax=Histophilus somni TaxID=731 RepID=A0A9Q6K6L8_HISSO|nr:outer membrane protein assembly factor BamE [Histophilus somni]ACA32634.1 SmpA/OmlA domain protein [Histophilus somni 2336]ARU64226.1 outer membrane protein assembly factor BamE [Histophilus somni]ARU66010.1 outer membrane protein assembly factor BamE [Histophilus somni]ARU67883.1 outer membrane protein assembly factor BamE [Histophilus somni]ARU69763.1 outer membrane protein assembly factor BamE [Histophilus somni]
MRLKFIIPAMILGLSVTACSSVQKIVYRIDVPQGNYLESTAVEQVKVGMNAQQVQYLLGTPMLIDPFSNQTWYYVFLQQKSYNAPEQHTFIVNFDRRGIVTDVNLDKPLPDVEKEYINNTIIQGPEAKRTSWWKFWR